MIPDLNLRLALISALAAAELVPRLDLEALRRQHPPDPEEGGDEPDDGDHVYNDNLARALASMPLPGEALARLRALTWTDDDTMFAIWPQFDGESGEFFIDDLSGLEACTSLEELSIYEGGAGEITSLAPLAGLRELASIRLYGPVADLSPLAGLAKLVDLSLRGIAIPDLGPLLALTGLKRLRLEWRYGAPAVDREAAQAVVDALARRAVDLEIVLPGHVHLRPQRAPWNEVRNPELEARIHADPDDEGAYLVYADWLQEQGDPLGELIALDHRLATDPSPELVEARRAHFVRHKERFLRHVEDRSELVWRLGHVRAARLSHPHTIAEILSTPAARFLTELRLFALHGQEVVDALIQAEPAPPLRVLALEQRSSSLDASPLWRRFPALRVLELADSGGLTVGDLDLPELRELSAARGHPLRPERWPGLEVLRLEHVDVEALAPVLERPPANLRVLALGGGNSDAFLAALAEAPILDRLEELDLSRSSPVGPAGVAAIRSALERFRRIPRRALRIGEETEEPLLRELCNHVPRGDV